MVKTSLKQPLVADRAVSHLPGWPRKGCCKCGAAEISCCRCRMQEIRCEGMEISCCRMRGTNGCISNIGLISNSSLADAGTGIRRGRGLDDTLRSIQRGPGSFRLVLLPFLCQRDVREHSYVHNGRESMLPFRVIYLGLPVAAQRVQECTGSPPRSIGR
jgi:hypothetical protein